MAQMVNDTISVIAWLQRIRVDILGVFQAKTLLWQKWSMSHLLRQRVHVGVPYSVALFCCCMLAFWGSHRLGTRGDPTLYYFPTLYGL